MTVQELILDLLDHPDRQLAPDQADMLRHAVDSHPASAALPAALLLRHGATLLSQPEADALRLTIAATATDRMAMFRIATDGAASFDEFFRAAAPVEGRNPGTDEAIDTFLETYGHQSPEEDALLERLIFNPVPDYSEVLAAQEDAAAGHAPADATADAIEAFLGKDRHPDAAPDPAPAPADAPAAEPATAPTADFPAATPEPDAAGALLSESLAKIFIKQGRYERAYEIISNLNLNFPQKSCYFADQLRFLQKLILIQQQQKSKTAPAPSGATEAEQANQQ